MEVVGGGSAQGRNSLSGSVNNSSMGMRSKIRHHVAPKQMGYSANLLGTSGVPMRLSASEVGDEEDSEDDNDSQRWNARRTGSGRSSLASGQRLTAYGGQRPPGRLSTGSTPPSGQGNSPAEAGAAGPNATANAHAFEIGSSETPVPSDQQRRATGGDYFQQPHGNGGSGSSGEGESSFGNVGDMKGPSANVTRKENEKKSAEELSRRGSVDERAATMRGAVRLFVANPDLSD